MAKLNCLKEAERISKSLSSSGYRNELAGGFAELRGMLHRYQVPSNAPEWEWLDRRRDANIALEQQAVMQDLLAISRA